MRVEDSASLPPLKGVPRGLGTRRVEGQYEGINKIKALAF